MKKFTLLLLVTLFYACIPTEEILPSGVTQTDQFNYISFEPSNEANTGFIYYPGAAVAPESYNEWQEDLAELGLLAITAKMPLNLAVLDVNAALKIKQNYPDIEHWIIGGHSLGGAMAIELINKPVGENVFEGLILMAAYPGATTNISEWQGRVLSLTASNDLIATSMEIEEGKARLPEAIEIANGNDIDNLNATYYYDIEGGNHAQFGNYGLQNGDGTATITAEEQQAEIVQLIQAFMIANSWN